MTHQELEVTGGINRQFLHGFTQQAGLGVAFDDDNFIAFLVGDQQEFSARVEAELTRMVAFDRTALDFLEVRGGWIDAEHQHLIGRATVAHVQEFAVV